jgi:phosphoribosylformylglycinamidine synthase
MAVVVASEHVDAFIQEATDENLEAYVVAEVTEEPRMVMRLDGDITVNLSREFLSSNGAPKHSRVEIPELPCNNASDIKERNPVQRLKTMVSDLRFCSQRGLGERFDGSIGAGSVIMPYGGKNS